MASETKVIHVPREWPSPTFGERLCQLYKAARLRALKEDPQAFLSTYDRESKFNDATWVQRLRNPLSNTFVAIRTEADSAEISEIEHVSQNEWLGMIVLLGPKALPADGSESQTLWNPFLQPASHTEAADPLSIVDSEAAYIAVSMFVLPEARRQGVGRKLIETSVEAARVEANSMRASRANIGLWVEAENVSAQKLYEACGFRFLSDDPALIAAHGVMTAQVLMGRLVELLPVKG
ncbi:uncharacterized protein PADG_02830 [Paracoccidioides brasiliensis Pb18]|uniref:N-acetyltransferase domain-containing protein n=1 Tax=Paracoccidioides brasiliensis (strain Pb18) TaxID=502780 RepID=C1G6M5_PARBD|nr:uncharacterized protein PADG_02830 [Paracoccidioides brasiliensis Pb18]EEH46732.2 hypothetical protein PADG_02830 [Paracoccidioides brasiliensis Pb18]ODH50405.1 hypothetical protein GX48_03520 [Paracoccidioides brasiliensis]